MNEAPEVAEAGPSADALSLVASIAHELRGPLTPLKGYLLALSEGTIEDSPTARQEYYDAMLRQIGKLERLTNLLERTVKLSAPDTPLLILEDELAPVVAVGTLSQTARVANREAGDGEVEGIEGARGNR